MSARDVIEHALRVYYADSRDPHRAVDKLLAQYDGERRVEVLHETVQRLHEYAEAQPMRGHHYHGIRAARGEVRRMADQPVEASEKDTRGGSLQQGESTPEPPRPHALPESSFARARARERIGGFFRCARYGRRTAAELRGVA